MVRWAWAGTIGAAMKRYWSVRNVPKIIPSSTDHPTPKPETLMKRFILWHTKEHDIVLDSFMGAGTTLRAAKDLNRRAIGIEIEERYWPTPTGPAPHDSENTVERHYKGKKQFDLAAAVNLWPTPMASDAERTSGTFGRGNQTLAGAARSWPTPCARDWKSSNASKETMSKNARPLNETVTNGAGGQLNPTWVEWLMGWPLGWTDLMPLATDRFRQWLQQHGVCFQERQDD